MAFLKIALLPKYEISPEKVLIERFSLRLTHTSTLVLVKDGFK